MFEIIDLARFFWSVSSKNSETVENMQRDEQQAKKRTERKKRMDKQ